MNESDREEALRFANELRGAKLRGVAPPQDWTSRAIGHIERLVRQSAPQTWECKARGGSFEPQDCNWPLCDCDPKAEKVIAALQECGLMKDSQSAPQQEPVTIRAIVSCLEGSAGNTDTSPKWRAASELRRIVGWETATLPIASPPAQPDVVRDALLREASRHLRQLRLVNLADRIDAIMSTRGEKP